MVFAPGGGNINHQSSMNFQFSTLFEKALKIENSLMIDD
jgi:hypothetical protein